jgi:hypothetical protein
VRRIAAAGALGAIVAAGLVVHGLLPDSAATDIAGDALYAVAIYAGLVVLLGRTKSAIVAALAAAWCIAVELLQLTGVPRALAEGFAPLALVFGTGFHARDLVVYVAAVAVAAIVDTAVRRRREGMSTSEAELEPV